MRRIRILPYGPSDGARSLSRATGVKRLKLPHSRFRPRSTDLIVNWGSSQRPFPSANYLNKPELVNVASSKIASLRKMKEAGVNVPEFTTERERVAEWLARGKRVLARTLDRASGGRGIVEISQDGATVPAIPYAGLYTLYIPKKHEYRLHVWRDQVLDVQQKKKRLNFPEAQFNGQIRNFDRGWVFARDGVSAPEGVISQSLAAVRALGLDFGAVDVGWTEKTQTATVYEVNTAPGVEGTTLQKYAAKIKALRS